METYRKCLEAYKTASKSTSGIRLASHLSLFLEAPYFNCHHHFKIFHWPALIVDLSREWQLTSFHRCVQTDHNAVFVNCIRLTANSSLSCAALSRFDCIASHYDPSLRHFKSTKLQNAYFLHTALHSGRSNSSLQSHVWQSCECSSSASREGG